MQFVLLLGVALIGCRGEESGAAAPHVVDALEEVGGEGMEFLTCRAEPGTLCGEGWKAAVEGGGPTNAFYSADRLVRAALAIAGDEECMTHSIDASSDADFYNEAAELFRKCHMVVIKNAMDSAYMLEYKRKFGDYVAALRNGTVEGKTSHGEEYFMKSIGDKRWLLLLPEEFGTPEVLAPFWIRKLLSHPRLLGDNFKLNDLGAAIAEPGAEAQHFHLDDEYLLGKNSLAINGVGGHDLPPTAITVLHPISPDKLTAKHGPTEFCMGSSALLGFDFPNAEENVADPKLLDECHRVYSKGTKRGRPRCDRPTPGGPVDAMRSDEIGLGDVVLFDYQIIHRGGANESPDVRTLLYATYARHWYGDSNFRSPYVADAVDFVHGDGWNKLSKYGKTDFARIVKASRFAKPDQDLAPRDVGECGALEDLDVPVFAYDPSENYEKTTRASGGEKANGGDPMWVTRMAA